ncbi:zinc ribbon domain-containing protein [Candidatus Bathyarchaeota archaeon]|jgi:hypothetical protein|nr:MAG: zinc ribbon domain-containing protein [Candidatus Bathyarchaeota archaeon]
MIFSMIAQEGIGSNWLLWLLPLAFCLLTITQKKEEPSTSTQLSDNFYTTLSVDDAFKTIQHKVDQWRIDAKESDINEKGLAVTLRKILGGTRAKTDRFTEIESKIPRLLNISDVTGSIYFEFIPVEDGGTVVKVTYSHLLNGRMKRLKAELPIMIPATPIGLKCPSCGKPVLKEFNLCPYCGTRLMKE